jgi:hypothetical protein
MKKFLAALAIVLFCASFAYSATLNWDAVPDTDDYTISGYVVYFWSGEDPGLDQRDSYLVDGATSLTNIEQTLNLLPGTTYTFTVVPYTTFNVLGEESPYAEFLCESRPLPENSLPTHIYIPGPINITIGAQ